MPKGTEKIGQPPPPNTPRPPGSEGPDPSMLGFDAVTEAGREERSLTTRIIAEAPLHVPWLTSSAFFNPNLDTGTEGRGQFLELNDALRDPRACACMDLRIGALASLPWTMVPQEGTPKEVNSAVTAMFNDMDFVQHLENLAKAFYYGMSPNELFWEKVGKYLLPSVMLPIDPLYCIFDTQRRLWVNGLRPPVGKVLLHRHGSLWRNPYGLGRGRTVPRWVRVKIAIAYSTYKDYPRFSHDRLLFTYKGKLSDAGNYMTTARQLLDNAGMMVPGEELDVKPIRLESKFEMGEKLIDAADAQIAVAILGNSLTTGEGRGSGIGSGSNSKTHQDTEGKQQWRDARGLESTLNTALIPWIVMVNWGPEVQPPRIKFDARAQPDQIQELQDLTGLAQGGIKIPLNWLREKFGIPAPEEGEDVWTPPQPAPPPVGPAKPEPPPIPKLSTEGIPPDVPTDHDRMDDWGAQFADRFGGFYRSMGRALREQVAK